MKNYIQRGDNITVPAPALVVSGEGVLIGSLFGIAATDAAPGEAVAISTRGVFALPKEATADTFAIGDPVEWDEVNARVAPLTVGDRVGVAVSDAGATATTVEVRLG